MHSLPLFRSNMAATAAKTVLKSVKPHVPLIKFPSRTPAPKSNNNFEVFTSKTDNKKLTSVASINTISHSLTSGQAIDSSQLPLKYHRKPITSEEIEIIEKGGRS